MTLIEIVFICGFAVYAFVMIVAIRREREKTKESNSFIEYVSGLVEPREKIILEGVNDEESDEWVGFGPDPLLKLPDVVCSTPMKENDPFERIRKRRQR